MLYDFRTLPCMTQSAPVPSKIHVGRYRRGCGRAKARVCCFRTSLPTRLLGLLGLPCVPLTGGAQRVRAPAWFARELGAMDGQFLPAGMRVPW
jgi:hypothetical protein